MSCTSNKVKSFLNHLDKTNELVSESSHATIPTNYSDQLANEFVFNNPEFLPKFKNLQINNHIGLVDEFFDAVQINAEKMQFTTDELEMMEKQWQNSQFESVWNEKENQGTNNSSWANEFKALDDNIHSENVQEVQKVSGSILDLIDSEDPKFQNSKFVKFLKDLNTGKLEIRENQLIVNEQVTTENEEIVNENATQQSAVYPSVPIATSSFPLNSPYHSEMHGWEEEFQNLNQMQNSKIQAVQDSVGSSAWSEEFQKDKILNQFKENDPVYDFPTWTNDYYQNISPIIERNDLEEWANTQKGWHEFAPTGFGYANYAKKTFGFAKEGDYTTAVDHIKHENEIEAIRCLHSALELDPQDLKSMELLTSLYYNQRCIPDMLQVINNFLMNHPEYKLLAPSLYVYQHKMERIPSSVQGIVSCLEALIKRYPDTRLYSFLCLIYASFDYFEASINVLKSAIEINPTCELWNRLGAFTLKSDENVDSAIEHFRHALKIEPSYNRAHYNLALCYLQKNDFQTAIKHVLSVLKGRPSVDIDEEDEVWKLLTALLEFEGWSDMLKTNPKYKVIHELEFVIERLSKP